MPIDSTRAGITGCHPHSSCEQIANAFLLGLKGTVPNIVLLIAVGLIYLVPGLIGVFWGAPLITREIETGTFKLAWTQSVTRTRWLAVKVGLIGLTAVAAAGLLSLMLGWWARPLFIASAKAGGNSSKIDRILPVLFGVNGVAPIGYAAFGFALGLAFGVLIRRTLPAMAATLAVFAAIQVAWPLLVRPHLIPALRGTVPITASNIVGLAINPGRQMFVTANAHKPGAWIISNQTVDAAGHAFTGPATQACLSGSQDGVLRLGRRPSPSFTDHIPASQPVLGPSGVRDRDLPRDRCRAGLVLLPAGRPSPADLTGSGGPLTP